MSKTAWEGKFKKGTYEPRNMSKYKGHFPLKYRSSWELLFMRWCDRSPEVVEWGSESVVVPYVDPIRHGEHVFQKNVVKNYIIDFSMVLRDRSGRVKKYLVEIKPWRQTQRPVRKKQSERTFLYEVLTYARNRAKWMAALEFARKRGAEFMLLTEKDFLKQ